MPMRQRDGIMLFPDHAALARGVLDAMDELQLLNRIQQQAFAACSDKFDWASRGRQLRAVIAAS
jgi:hypothetical protein